MKTRKAILVSFISAVMCTSIAIPTFLSASFGAAILQDAGGQKAIARSLGVIKAINGNSITLTPTTGPEVVATVAPNARLLRLASGDKDLKNATPIQLQELQVGDTVRVRGYASEDNKSINALEVILITRSAVQAASEQVRQDWQKRGIGGIVEAVDPASGNVNISIPGLTGKKSIVVHTTKATIVRRYAPDSAKAEDAKLITLQQVQPGDQLRARGNRSADGSEVTAEEIYVGVFPRFVGTVKSIDASAGALSLQDLATKKTVQLKITPDSQLHKIPQEMAQHFAMRLKAMMPAGTPGSGSAPSPDSARPAPAGGAPEGQMAPGTGTGGGKRAGGPPDFQQMVSRLPTSSLSDLNLQKGDAVVILATEGTSANPPNVITLLSGVEPILQASPSGSQAMMLAPWSLGGPPGGDNGNQ